MHPARLVDGGVERCRARADARKLAGTAAAIPRAIPVGRVTRLAKLRHSGVPQARTARYRAPRMGMNFVMIRSELTTTRRQRGSTVALRPERDFATIAALRLRSSRTSATLRRQARNLRRRSVFGRRKRCDLAQPSGGASRQPRLGERPFCCEWPTAEPVLHGARR